jgi:quercetin dioxygenase-like cupin family protein
MLKGEFMRSLKVVLFVVLTLAGSTALLLAQDPAKVDPTHYKVLIDNAAVRVLRISYAPGSKSVMHEHPDSVVVVLNGGKTKFTMPDGTSQEQDMAANSALYLPAGKHLPMNTGTAANLAILVEFKTAAPGKAALPASRAGLTLTSLAEGPRATTYKATAAPAFAEPAGTKHDFDQVIIALAPTQMSLAIEGKPARTTWAKGDVEFIGRGVAHESKNAGAKPTEFAIVAIK